MLVAALLATALVPLGAATSLGGSSPVYERFELRYTTKNPNARTGALLRVKQRDTPAGQQPPAIRRNVIGLAPGSRINTRAVRRCTASDATLQLGGRAACPGSSRLGTGEADVFLGAAGTSTFDVTAFNARRQIVVLLTSRASGAVIRVLRARVRGSRISATFPRIPLGSYEVVLTRFELTIRPRGSRARPWARTPRSCPRARRWRTSYLAVYDPPIGPQRLRDTSRCLPRRH